MKRLSSILKDDHESNDIILLIESISSAAKEIAFSVRRGELSGVTGSADVENVQGEVQKRLDIIANDILKRVLVEDGSVRAIASEEEDMTVVCNEDGQFLVAFDPLDGSSNIDVNGQIGTIFTVYHAIGDLPSDSAEQFYQSGATQLAAGYILFGAATILVLTVSDKVRGFTFDPMHGDFILSHEAIHIPASSSEFSVNIANYAHWLDETKQYFDALLQGESGPIAKQYSMRWNAAMVGDMHRILCRGGIYLYPEGQQPSLRSGKIRLLYEANPLALLVERAGGKATHRGKRILDLEPSDLHQRVSVAAGCASEVDLYNRYIKDSDF